MNAPQTYVQTPEAKVAYDARWRRVMDCVALKTPDRMPTAMFATFFLAKFGGISNRELMYNDVKATEIAERVLLEFEPDCYNPLVLNVAMGPVLDALDYKQLTWPGHGVGDNQPYQYLDREYMKPEEYDEFIFDPTAFYLTKYLPRVLGVFEGMEELPYLPGLHYFRLIGGMRAFAKPRVRAALEKIMKAAEEVDRFANVHAAFTERMTAQGFPTSHISTSVSPYQW